MTHPSNGAEAVQALQNMLKDARERHAGDRRGAEGTLQRIADYYISARLIWRSHAAQLRMVMNAHDQLAPQLRARILRAG